MVTYSYYRFRLHLKKMQVLTYGNFQIQKVNTKYQKGAKLSVTLTFVFLSIQDAIG